MRIEDHNKRKFPTPPVVKTEVTPMYSPEGEKFIVNKDRAKEFAEKGFTDTPAPGGKRGSK